MKNTRLAFVGMLLLLVGLTAVFSRPAAAAPTVDFVVNTLDDTNDGTCDAAHCSLREALIIANGNPDQNTITFAVSGTILLGSTLTVGHDLVIDGTGQAVSISGDDKVRVLTLTAGETVPILELKALTITGGSSSEDGAGIFNNGGDLIISNSAIMGNVATRGGGGGIFNSAGSFTTISASRIEDNETTFSGGAIYNHGVLRIEGTTIAGNEAVVDGAAIHNLGGTLTLDNITLVNNTTLSSSYVILQQNGATTMTNSTIAGNAPAGIGNFVGTFTVANTIIAGHAAGNCAGTISNGGHNIDSGSTCGWGSANGSLSNTNPQLAPPADNGGPAPTAALLPGSPAIDMVPAADCPLAADQRGVPRPQGAACDAGAVEMNPQSGPDLVVNVLNEADGSCDAFVPGASDCSLREAMRTANMLPGQNTITFSVSGGLTLDSALPVVGDDLLIDGGNNVSMYGRDQYRLFTLVAGDNTPVLELLQLFMFDGAADNGGAILNLGGELLVTESTVESSTAGDKGGGIYNDGGAVTIRDSSMGGHAAASGGALYNRAGTLTVERSWFYANTAASAGVVLTNESGTVSVINSTFAENSAAGADTILNQGGSTTVINSSFGKNSSQAGTLNNSAGSVVVRNTILDDAGQKNCAGTISNGGNNIDSGASCGWGAANGAMSSTDPLLGPMSFFGGLTPVYSLLPDSPAIDGVVFDAPNECPATDQRGVARPQGALCDIGAFEVAQDPPPPPPPAGNMVFLPVVLGE